MAPSSDILVGTAGAPAPSVAADRYDGVAQALHWIIALLIFSTVPLGWLAVNMPREKGVAVIALHKSIGVTVLSLMLVRLVWRLTHRPPPLPMRGPLAAAAALSHWLLYGVFLLMPISGFVQSSSGGHGVSLYGLVDLPQLPQSEALSDAAKQAHLATQWAVYSLIVVHLAAVVWHVAVRRDGLVGRMLPPQDGG